MIDPNRLRDVSAFLDFAATDLAPKLHVFHQNLKNSGFSGDQATTLTVTLLQSIIAVPSPTEK